MPKAILEFNLPEDREEHLTAVKAMDYRMAISILDDFLRGVVKYDGANEWKGKGVEAQMMRDMLWEILKDRGIYDL